MSQTDNLSPLDQLQPRLLDSQETSGYNAYFQVFLETLLRVLLEESDAKDPDMEVFAISDGKFVLAFDTDENFSAFVDRPRLCSRITGRDLLKALAGKNIGVIVNANAIEGAAFLTPEQVSWALEMSDQSLEIHVSTNSSVARANPSDEVLDIIQRNFNELGGFVDAAYLCNIQDDQGNEALTLALVNCAAEAQLTALLTASDMSRFNPKTAVAIALVEAGSEIEQKLQQIGVRIEFKVKPQPVSLTATAPGMDPDRPPKLR